MGGIWTNNGNTIITSCNGPWFLDATGVGMATRASAFALLGCSHPPNTLPDKKCEVYCANGWFPLGPTCVPSFQRPYQVAPALALCGTCDGNFVTTTVNNQSSINPIDPTWCFPQAMTTVIPSGNGFSPDNPGCSSPGGASPSRLCTAIGFP